MFFSFVCETIKHLEASLSTFFTSIFDPPALAKGTMQEDFSDPSEGERAVNRFKNMFFDSFGITIAEERKSPLPKVTSSWIVMPYQLCLVMSGFAKVCSSLVVPLSLLSVVDKVRLSWKLSCPHLIHRLRRKVPRSMNR